MASRPWYIPLETSRGPIYVYPKEVTGVDALPHHTTPVSIYHGAQGRATVYITWDEARGLIGMLPKPWNCPAYSGYCYGRRETETPSPSCLSCLLRKLCYVNREGDLRMRLEKPTHPLKIPFVWAVCSALCIRFFVFMAVDPVIEHNAQLRAQVASFRRQSPTHVRKPPRAPKPLRPHQ